MEYRFPRFNSNLLLDSLEPPGLHWLLLRRPLGGTFSTTSIIIIILSCFLFYLKEICPELLNVGGKVLDLSFYPECPWEVAVPASLRFHAVLRERRVRPWIPWVLWGCAAVAPCAPVGDHAWGQGLQVLHLLLCLEPPDRRSFEHGLHRSLHPWLPLSWTFIAPLLLHMSRNELLPPEVSVLWCLDLPHTRPVISESPTVSVDYVTELMKLFR